MSDVPKVIKVGSRELSESEFLSECRDAGVKQSDIDRFLEKGEFGWAGHPSGGEIKVCPSCEKIRHTSCCACGCGCCSVCGYSWTCRPVGVPMNIKAFIGTLPRLPDPSVEWGGGL